MGPLGLKEPLEHQRHSMESPTLNNLPPPPSPVSKQKSDLEEVEETPSFVRKFSDECGFSFMFNISVL